MPKKLGVALLVNQEGKLLAPNELKDDELKDDDGVKLENEEGMEDIQVGLLMDAGGQLWKEGVPDETYELLEAVAEGAKE